MAVAPMRCRSEPSTEANTNSVADGATASSPTIKRNAAQSAEKAKAQTAAADASTNPGSTGAGATTSLKSVQASARSTPAASRVAPVGSPTAVVSGYSTQAT